MDPFLRKLLFVKVCIKATGIELGHYFKCPCPMFIISGQSPTLAGQIYAYYWGFHTSVNLAPYFPSRRTSQPTVQVAFVKICSEIQFARSCQETPSIAKSLSTARKSGSITASQLRETNSSVTSVSTDHVRMIPFCQK